MSERSEEHVAGLLRELGSHGFGGINPDERQLRTLLGSDEAGPLQFVNLLSYFAEARYHPKVTSWPMPASAAPRPTGATGRSRWTMWCAGAAPSPSTTTCCRS